MGKTSTKKILVLKPIIDNRYSEKLISTHNNITHECHPILDWNDAKKRFDFKNDNLDTLFLDEVQFMKADETLENVDDLLNSGINVVCAGLDQDSRGKPWETSSLLLGLADKITKIYGFCNICGQEATKTYRKNKGGERTKVGASDVYEPRCLKHWKPQ